MNQLSTEARSQIIRCLVEGNGIRATHRLTGRSLEAILKLLGEIGGASRAYVHSSIRCTPAMEAGVTDHIWDVEEIVGLLDETPKRRREA